ncbi:IclR family transcriptional regulator [Meiothermus sp. Pnk-1]|uniref:IclR family transcriptional regulator n=1 Tax=Meiothermus sp. Pnk-1 TaxID=873128 RepID=UPI000D7C96AE|nr:IclR family transcriptional regulator [Meiothermus sp. Pnk-1]PZA07483.1 IclR family transcriptional regulator [Meiothermus sp. Pnk-1]
MPNQPLTPAIHVAVRILDVLADSSQPLTLSEISRRAEVPKASVYRALNSLCAERLVEMESGVYRLGPRVLEFSAAYSRQLDIVQIFQRVAVNIVQEIDETVQMAQLEGKEVIFIAKADCTKLIRPATFVGRRVPAHATAVGKVLLSELPESRFFQLYGEEQLPALTPYTITSRHELRKELLRVRERGYAATRQEGTRNLCCVSAPIRDGSGNAVAALSVCMATEEPEPERREQALRYLLWGAKEISARLGWSEPAQRVLGTVTSGGKL